MINNQSIRRRSFQSMNHLNPGINTLVDHRKQHPSPFKWTATADPILAKHEQPVEATNGTRH
jgi:hypothetical protein